MKNLYIMRHGSTGKAEKLELEDDTQRPLTKKGRRVTRDVVKGMHDRGVELDLIITGTHVRALETARIAAKIYGIKNRIVELDTISPGGPVDKLIADMAAQTGDEQNVLVVGHAPQVNRLVSSLISGFKHANIELKKSGICHVTFETLTNGKCATLQSLLTRNSI